MQQIESGLSLSASDLNNYLACPYLVRLDLEVARGRRARAVREDAAGDLVRRKGDEHEQRYLDLLKAQGKRVVEIARGPGAVAETEQAIATGPDVIYQAAFEDGDWRGFADFLFRVDQPDGTFSYEPADTKLAKGMKPYFVLQLCVYAEALAKLQGSEPEHLHVVLGTREQQTVARRDFAAYFRRMRSRFLDDIAHDRLPSQPEPVEHCALCPWHDECQGVWERQDHLSLVAGIRRDQAARLREAGIGTLEALAQSPPKAPPGFNPAVFAKLQDQARLQLQYRETGVPAHRVLPKEEGRGFALLPRPDDGDIFFDMEGDPHVTGGLEYLFGYVLCEKGAWEFEALWAHDAAAERKAFETFVDAVVERRRQFPGMRVYHYAAYEAAALKRLACQYGTREAEIDDILRHNVLVDLYRVVRQGLRVGQPSYSIKKLEVFYMDARQADVKDAGSSIVAYERWLETQDQAILDDIGAYNEEDCRSTQKLRDWLLALRDPGQPWFEPAAYPPPEQREVTDAQTAALRAALQAGLPEDPAADTPDQAGRRLLADLLDYHRREDKPVWWAYFDRAQMDDDELLDDPDCIGGLELVGQVRTEKQSGVWRFRFLPQQHKFKVGETAHDAKTGTPVGTLVAIRDDRGELEIKRALTRGEPWPTAIKPGGPLKTDAQRDALRRVAGAMLAGDGRFQALADILTRAIPRVHGRPAGSPLQGAHLGKAEASAICRNLDGSHLVIQGPPGAGKTYTGARLIADLLAAGKRVGVSALSHKAIHNLLSEVERVAHEQGVALRGLKKSSGSAESRNESRYGLIDNNSDSAWFTDRSFNLIAGTAWLFAREELAGTLDYLFLDEAGQISIADAVAMGTSACNLVLLGDPQQLPQVSQGTHPGGAGKSILEHLLGDHQTIPPDRGLFLPITHRMHPDICAFVSEVSYEERLHAKPGLEQQSIAGVGAGLRYMPVPHTENAQASKEEAAAIAGEIGKLLGRKFTDSKGATRHLAESDILVVAPYNLQIKCLRDVLPDGVRAGTVDKFQGQEAPVVFFSMATSSGEDLPRNLEFLFSRNRLNVAISRAQCLAYLVASPRLLDVPCRTLDQMKMVNGLCRLVELAQQRSDLRRLW